MPPDRTYERIDRKAATISSSAELNVFLQKACQWQVDGEQ